MKEEEATAVSVVRLATVTTVDQTRNKATDAARQAARSVLGTTKSGRGRVGKQAWTVDVKASAQEKATCF